MTAEIHLLELLHCQSVHAGVLSLSWLTGKLDTTMTSQNICCANFLLLHILLYVVDCCGIFFWVMIMTKYLDVSF